ncbi:MAG: class I SAM-dependent methyltransferase [Flavobacteriales bacterium]|nr:class I SAM-dependent methyltransferase [Flavobacteriales bacterium]
MEHTVVSAPAWEAFSRQAPVFDAIDEGNAAIARMRGIVRAAALRHMVPGDRVLELNAGTGIDSVFFAEAGLRVTATDAAPGMIAQLARKQAERPALPLTVKACSFLELTRLGDDRFDHVFSNFGGLNCTDRLDLVLRDADALLRPGGTCTLVLMPRFSPWEMAAALKGRFRFAARRWHRNGTSAQVEGARFTCYYHGARDARRALPGYTVLEQRALALLMPPPHITGFPSTHAIWLQRLHRAEETIAHRWPFRAWGDHFLISLRKPA